MNTEVLDNATKSPLWPEVERGIVKALSTETANVEISEVIERIEKHELIVMVSRRGEDPVMGVAVVSREDDWIDVPFLWSAGLESLNDLFEGVELLARALGCKGVKWATANEKSETFATRRGYRKRLVEYVKEV